MFSLISIRLYCFCYYISADPSERVPTTSPLYLSPPTPSERDCHSGSSSTTGSTAMLSPGSSAGKTRLLPHFTDGYDYLPPSMLSPYLTPGMMPSNPAMLPPGPTGNPYGYPPPLPAHLPYSYYLPGTTLPPELSAYEQLRQHLPMPPASSVSSATARAAAPQRRPQMADMGTQTEQGSRDSVSQTHLSMLSMTDSGTDPEPPSGFYNPQQDPQAGLDLLSTLALSNLPLTAISRSTPASPRRAQPHRHAAYMSDGDSPDISQSYNAPSPSIFAVSYKIRM